MYLLLDCNNFFVSCERAFNPKLQSLPTAVLSNNDGCVVARSNEVKKLGVPMGAPVFKWKDLVVKHNIQLLSANFQLYGDLSNRVMQIMKEIAQDVQIYSIDEAFVPLKHEHVTNYENYAQEMRDRVMKWVGIPVSVGIAPTKTLAKAANEFSKKLNSKYKGVLVLESEDRIDFILKKLDVGEIWGVGYRFTERLKSKGIYTAYDFKMKDSRWVRDFMGVSGQRTHMELNSTPCIEIHSNDDSRKMIMSSRSFGKPVLKFEDLRESVVTYIGRAAEKLRKQNSLCSFVTVSVRSSKHKGEWDQYYSKSHTVALAFPTDVNFSIIKSAEIGLKQIYKKGIKYKKTSVLLSGVIPRSAERLDLFRVNDVISREKDSKTMKIMDGINKEYGKNTIIIGSQNVKQPWIGRNNTRSPRYTSSWAEIPVVKT